MLNDFLHQLTYHISNARGAQLDHMPRTTMALANASIQCLIVLTISAPDNAATSYRYDSMPLNPRPGNVPVHGQKFLPIRDSSMVSKSEGASRCIACTITRSFLAAALRLGAALRLRKAQSPCLGDAFRIQTRACSMGARFSRKLLI